jgi:hypothetical protein
VLAGLGLTYSGQKREQKTITEELEISRDRLDKAQDTGVQLQQISQLEERLTDSQGRLDEAKQKLLQAILSVDVAEKFFQIADASGVVVMTLGTTSIQETKVSDVDCYKISVQGTVNGEFLKLVDFIINLDQNYITGFVKTAQITIDTEKSSTDRATVQVEVYSSKGL